MPFLIHHHYCQTAVLFQQPLCHLGCSSRKDNPASADCLSCAVFAFLLFLLSCYLPFFFPLSTSFNISSPHSTSTVFFPFHPGARRDMRDLYAHCLYVPKLSCCPFGSDIFHMRYVKEYRERKRVCFPGPFSYFIPRYRHTSGLPQWRSFLHLSAALPFPTLEHPPISLAC